jgi:hypothetical protein
MSSENFNEVRRANDERQERSEDRRGGGGTSRRADDSGAKGHRNQGRLTVEIVGRRVMRVQIDSQNKLLWLNLYIFGVRRHLLLL